MKSPSAHGLYLSSEQVPSSLLDRSKDPHPLPYYYILENNENNENTFLLKEDHRSWRG